MGRLVSEFVAKPGRPSGSIDLVSSREPCFRCATLILARCDRRVRILLLVREALPTICTFYWLASNCDACSNSIAPSDGLDSRLLHECGDPNGCQKRL